MEGSENIIYSLDERVVAVFSVDICFVRQEQ
jgi:hypothetical protein